MAVWAFVIHLCCSHLEHTAVAVEMVRGWAGIASYALEVEEVAETSRDHPQT